MSNFDDELELLVNAKQEEFFAALLDGMDVRDVKVAGMVGGIGSGKSVAMSDLAKMMVEELPRAKGQFACPVVTQAKRSLTPGLRAGWRDRWNCVPFDPGSGAGEYVLWKEPPKWFDRPYQEPDDWDNCISFANGFTIEVCGYKLDPDAHRGRNDDFVLMDEALRFKREWLKIALGRIRANPGKYDSNLHWLFAFFSSPPYGASGEWMWEYEEKMKRDPKRYFFVHVKTKDNLMFLPPGYIDGLKESLTDLEFKVEVQGQRLSKVPKAYYDTLDFDHHTDIDDIVNFYDENADMETSVDFNAHFTCCTVYQGKGNLGKGIKAMHVKSPFDGMTMSESLAKKLDDQFKHHKRKRIYVTGDRNGQNKSAGSNLTMFEQFAAVLEAAGWEVILLPLTYNPEHFEKYLLLHETLAETNPEAFHLRFHPQDFKAALVSMMFTPITTDYKKDKKSETKLNVEQENATHYGDTVDYYVVWKKKGGIGYTDSGFDIDFM
jgi:hypothetical protein